MLRRRICSGSSQLRQAGALEVATAQVLMQKGRPGMAIVTLVLPGQVTPIPEVSGSVLAPAWVCANAARTGGCWLRVSAGSLGGVTRRRICAGRVGIPVSLKVEHDELRRVSLELTWCR